MSSVLAGDPVTMGMNGETAFTALAQLLNFDIQLADGDDTLTLGSTGVPTVLDMGLGAADLLNGPNSPSAYNITGAGTGNVPGVANTFTGLERIAAGTAADSFVFAAAGILSGPIDGNLGADTLDLTAVAAPVVNVTGLGTLDGVMGTASTLGSGFDNINLAAGTPATPSVVKSGPAEVNVGEPIPFTIDVTNAGPNAAILVTLTDVLPAGTTFVSLALAAWLDLQHPRRRLRRNRDLRPPGDAAGDRFVHARAQRAARRRQRRQHGDRHHRERRYAERAAEHGDGRGAGWASRGDPHHLDRRPLRPGRDAGGDGDVADEARLS